MDPSSQKLVLESFVELDKAGVKALPEAELRSALLAKGLVEAEVSALFAAAGAPKDGLIEYARLVDALAASAPAPVPAGVAPPRIVAVCGGSCSGKSTIASKLASELNQGREDCKAICADNFFVFDQYLTDNCPTKCVNGHVWKDWESAAAIDWTGLVEAVQQAAHASSGSPFLVVEGFLLLAKSESRSLFNAAIMVTLSKEECWRRRRSRAESMAHLPPGFSNSDQESNYEVLETYILSSADPAAISAEAAGRYPDEGKYAWLRMFFEEVIWPMGLEQQAALEEASAGGMPVLRLDGDSPVGKEPWQQVRFPEAVDFLRQAK